MTRLDLAPSAAEADPALLCEELARHGKAVVALSGGVDSAVVAWLAFEALHDEAQAVTLTGPAVGRDEVERARRVAASVGIAHRLLPVDPLTSPEYQANPSNRCFFCRTAETTVLRGWGDPLGVRQYLDGVHRDDLADDRPGLAAMNAAGFRHPLAEAGWGKARVRAFAREVGLPNWDAPSDACLASRVPHGNPISAELLGRIEAAEARIRVRGFRRVRVRTDGRSARVEVDPDEVERLLAPPTAAAITGELRELGFAEPTLDPHGYRRRPGA